MSDPKAHSPSPVVTLTRQQSGFSRS